MWWFNRIVCSLWFLVRSYHYEPRTIYHKPTRGFSLLESLIATAIVGIGFTGVYSMIVLSEQFTKWAIARQKLQLYANQMLEVIESDIANIDSYNLSFTTCTDPGAVTTVYLLRGYEWCTRMNAQMGAAGTDTRSITITTPSTNKRNVLIRLEAYGAKAQVIMERSYGI